MTRLNTLRWILVLPSAFGGWWIALVIGISLYSVADYFCPVDEMISGMCIAHWHKSVVDLLVIFGAGLSAMLAILASVLVAPNQKHLVALLVFLGGAAFALYFAIATREWFAFTAAIVFGAAVAYFTFCKYRGTSVT